MIPQNLIGKKSMDNVQLKQLKPIDNQKFLIKN